MLLSTISNAWFLIHSQVLAYEFLNFATKGVFIGSREVYLESHVDDLFLENELWDPTTNTTDLSRSFRMDAAAVQNTRASVDALRPSIPRRASWSTSPSTAPARCRPSARGPTRSSARSPTPSCGRTTRTRTSGTRTEGEVRVRTGESKRTLLRFDVAGLAGSTAEKATLTLFTDGSDEINAKICAVTNSWDEGRGGFS